MCDTCGCNITPGNQHLVESTKMHAPSSTATTAVDVLQGLLSENDRQASHNRQHFDSNKVFTVNLMSSPGAGKTALLEATIDELHKQYAIAVIEGDLETENDALRIRAKGIEAVQISTGSACHLDAHMVHHALHQLDLAKLDIVFIENVGNLVCPASFDLGHHRNVTLLSVTEGDDKPLKYPVMFRTTDVMLLTKIDLLDVMDDFDPEIVQQNFRQLANTSPVILTSIKTGAGMIRWLNWLEQQMAHFETELANGKQLKPKIHSSSLHQNTASKVSNARYGLT